MHRRRNILDFIWAKFILVNYLTRSKDADQRKANKSGHLGPTSFTSSSTTSLISHTSSETHAYHVNMPIIRRNRKAYLAELRTSITRPVSGHLGLHNDHMAVTFDVNRASYIFETLADQSTVTFACCPTQWKLSKLDTNHKMIDYLASLMRLVSRTIPVN